MTSDDGQPTSLDSAEDIAGNPLPPSTFRLQPSKPSTFNLQLSTAARATIAVAGWLVATWIAWSVVPVWRQAAVRPTDGFGAYYTAARLVREGADPARFYDDDWFRGQVRRLVPGADDIYFVNPPLGALIALPLTGFGPTGARVIWTVFSLVVLAAGLAGAVALLRLDWMWYGWIAALVIWFPPVTANLEVGQAYLTVFGLLVVAWWGDRSGHERFLGLSLGLLLALKLAAGPLWLLLISRRRRTLSWAGGTVLLLAVAAFPWIGIDSWIRFVRYLIESGADPSLASIAYQGLPSLLRRLFRFDPIWNPVPVADLPWLGALLTALLTLVLLAWTVWSTRRSPDRAVPAFVCLSFILSPVAADYHATLLLIPVLAVARSMVNGSIGQIGRIGRIVNDVSPYTFHVSRFTFHASRFAFRVSPLHYYRGSDSAFSLQLSAFVLSLWLLARDPLLPLVEPAGLQALLAYPLLAGALLLWCLLTFNPQPATFNRR